MQNGRVAKTNYYCTECKVGDYVVYDVSGNAVGRFSLEAHDHEYCDSQHLAYDSVSNTYGVCLWYLGKYYPVALYAVEGLNLKQTRLFTYNFLDFNTFGTMVGTLSDDEVTEIAKQLADGFMVFEGYSISDILDASDEDLRNEIWKIGDGLVGSIVSMLEEYGESSEKYVEFITSNLLPLLVHIDIKDVDIFSNEKPDFEAEEMQNLTSLQKTVFTTLFLYVKLAQAELGMIDLNTWKFDNQSLFAFLKDPSIVMDEIIKDVDREGLKRCMTGHCYAVKKTIGVNGNAYYTVISDICNYAHTVKNFIEPTCTQYGLKEWTSTCKICGSVEYENEERVVAPNGHNWVYNEERGIYICSECNMENANGATGAVSLEDFTDYENNPDALVVGYYDRAYNVSFGIEISLIYRADPSNPDKQLVVKGVPLEITGLDLNGKAYYRYTDEGHFVKFSRSDVIEKAKAQRSDINIDEYDIRMSFVPLGSEGQLDYGITFGSLNKTNE